jgi:hypothetical protein
MFVILALLTVNASALNTTQADVDFVEASTNDTQPNIDPGYARDVASWGAGHSASSHHHVAGKVRRSPYPKE